MNKYFIAIVPPEQISENIYAIKKECERKFDTKGALLSPAHITLHMPFNFKAEKEFDLIQCLKQFQFKPVFEIELNNFGCFEPRVIFINIVKNELLYKLQETLVFHVKSNLNIFNQYEAKRGFHPHVTIAFRDLKKNKFHEAWGVFKESNFSATFTCKAFSLLRQEKKNWEVITDFYF